MSQNRSPASCRPSLPQNANMTKRNIMAAILQAPGPVSTHRAVNTGWRFLRMVTNKQFKDACTALQQINLGILVELPGRCSPVFIFVKTRPENAAPFLQVNFDLCTPEYYAQRYRKSVAKAVTPGIRDELMRRGLLSQLQWLVFYLVWALIDF